MSFDRHMLNDNGIGEVDAFKSDFVTLIKRVASSLPDSKEKAMFITKAEEASFWGTKAIASKEDNHSEVISY